MFKKLTVREAEAIARRIAYERARKKDALLDPETQELEEALTESLGTRVMIEKNVKTAERLPLIFSRTRI